MLPKLPADLFKAYEWTASAGELGELRATRPGRDLADYSLQSSKNYAAHTGDPSDMAPMATDLYGLNSWLRGLNDEDFAEIVSKST